MTKGRAVLPGKVAADFRGKWWPNRSCHEPKAFLAENRCHVQEEEMRDDHWIEQQGFSIFDPDIEDEPTAADEPDPTEDDAAWHLTLLED